MSKGGISPYDPRTTGTLRVSKSSFIKYLNCPRQFWFDYMMLYNVQTPRSPQMIRGTDIHKVMEDALQPRLDPIPLTDAVMEAAKDMEYDEGVNTLAELLEYMAEDHGVLNIISLEEKIVVYDEENDVDLVGMIDGLFRHPDGGIMIVELKTGNLTKSKISKYRKELAFYQRVLTLQNRFPDDEITHYCFIAPDCVDDKLFDSLMNQKKQKRDIFVGNLQGIAIIEPITKRSITGLQKDLAKAVEGIKTQQWPIKWNDYFCTEWCDYHLSCETELMGGDSVVVANA